MERTALDGALAWVQPLLNRLLHFDPDSHARLTALAGRVICLELRDQNPTPARLYVMPTPDDVQLTTTYPGSPDVTIAGGTAMFARQLFRRSSAPVAGELQISGDIELGQRFQRMLQGLDIDSEEIASRVVGDIPARQLGNIARGVRAWAAGAARTLVLDASEYVQEEARVMAKREQVEAFLRAVDRLRADTDRLAQRVQLAKAKL